MYFESKLGTPSVNFGLHGGLDLVYLLHLGMKISLPGDLIILPLEDKYYDCNQDAMTDWQINNYLAWNQNYLMGLPLKTRFKIAISQLQPYKSFKILFDFALSNFNKKNPDRERALSSDNNIESLFSSGKYRTDQFSYSAFNLDARGTMKNAIGSFATGHSNPEQPKSICQDSLFLLSNFIDDMNKKSVLVYFAYTPYLIDKPIDKYKVEIADIAFRRDLESINAQVIGKRSSYFYNKDSFFDLKSHLNELGQRDNTEQFIKDIKKIRPSDR